MYKKFMYSVYTCLIVHVQCRCIYMYAGAYEPPEAARSVLLCGMGFTSTRT